MRRFVSALLTITLLAAVAIAQQGKPETPSWSVPDDAKFTAEDVSITRNVETNDGEAEFKIAGTVRIPTGQRPEGGFPAVLFISGSGSQTRHGFQGNLDIGSWELLDAVANAGFVVLATDDRGIGETPLGIEGKKPEDLGYLDLVGDAQAALDYLNSREEVNTAKVFLIGHSEGGLTAPILAGDNPKVAGVVFMAAAGRNMYDITLQQVEEAMASQPRAQRENNLKAQREFQDAVKENREPDFNLLGKAAAPVLKQTWKASVLPIRKWWHEHFNLDVPAIHSKLTCPVFVTNGKSDFQVSPERDAKQIVKDLMEGKCDDVTMKIYDDLDHLFKPCNGRKSELKIYFEDRRVSPEFIKDVVEWLTAIAS
ncbi:MAG: alpha/beta fold hydrolase [Planctomycetes bacterium]|nr:alpha/beta fold hydrolase [Planctomycetota bacterium]MCA8945037.1 alpha/beta fold hydrolase [Planctomycetota bacterium]